MGSTTTGSHPQGADLIRNFYGKYYFNNDHQYNFVQVAPFDDREEKVRMLKRFPDIAPPKADHDLPALKINMRRHGGSDEMFTHDTLYNVEIEERRDEIVMRCWTGDMQLTQSDAVSRSQAKGKTVVTLSKASGLASMDIGGGWGAEKWVMRGEPLVDAL